MNAPVVLSAVLAGLLLVGCRKNVVEPACSGQCTTIKGRFVTDNGTVGIAKLPVEVQWLKNNGVLSGIMRRKATAKTNADGYYELSFYVKDDELKDGRFVIKYDAAKASYITDRDQNGASFMDLPRDTTVVSNWLLPRKAYVHFEVSNPSQAPTHTAFTTFKFNNGPWPSRNGFSYGVVASWTNPPIADIEVAANQPIVIETGRSIGPSPVFTRDTIRLAPGNRHVHRVSF